MPIPRLYLSPRPVSLSSADPILSKLLGVHNFLCSVSSQQKFEVTDVKALGVSQLLDRSVLQLCVTAQFNLENKGKYIHEA